jgi:hypothetical protein
VPRKNTLADLRDHLFEVIEGLKDEEKPMDIERANAVVSACKEVVNLAKVQLGAMKLRGDVEGDFLLPEQTEAAYKPNGRTQSITREQAFARKPA